MWNVWYFFFTNAALISLLVITALLALAWYFYPVKNKNYKKYSNIDTNLTKK